MGLAGTLARRSLLNRPGRTLFSILGVAVGIATVVGIFTLDHNTVLSRRARVSGEWKADLEVRPGRDVSDPRTDLSEIPGVDGVAAFFQNLVLFRTEYPPGQGPRPGGRRIISLVAMDSGAGSQIGAYHLSAGRDIDPGAAVPELLLGQALADEFELVPGDTIYLAIPPRMPKKKCVDGEFREVGEAPPEPDDYPFVVAGVMAHENLGRRAMGQIVVVDHPSGLELYADSFVESAYWLKRDPDVAIERLESALGPNYSYAVNREVIIGEQYDEAAFRNGVQFAGLVALMLGLFVIFHTLSMSLVERMREVALLHALGTTRGQIARVFFAEALIIALCAGALGLAGGLGLARLMLQEGITTLGVGPPVDVFDVPWHLVAPLVATGVAIALLGSVFPLLKARENDTISALRGEDLGQRSRVARGFHIFATVLLALVLPAMYFFIVPVVGEANRELVGVILIGVGILTLLVGVPLLAPSLVSFVCKRIARPFEELWPLAGKLAARSIEQSPSRIAASVAAIALVTAAFVGLKGMTNSLRAETEIWAEEAVVQKVWVKGLPNADFEVLRQKLLEYPGVIAVEPADTRVSGQFLMIGVREDEIAKFGPAQDGELPLLLRDEQGIILSRRLALHKKWNVGDRISVGTSGSGVQYFPVVGISDAYGYSPHPDERMYGVVSDRHIDRYFCVDRDTCQRIAVRMEGPADPVVIETAVRELYPNEEDIQIESGTEILAAHVDDIGRDFVLFDIIFGLTALLAGLGVLNGQLLAALERSNELGVLRALGMTRRQVAGMVLLESAVVGVCGGLLGLALGGALTPVIVEALQVVSGLPLPHRSAGAYLALCLAGALVLTLLAGLYPIWRMNRLDAVRAVRAG